MPERDFSHVKPDLKLDSGAELTADLQSDVRIESTNLEEEFLHQPERYAWWASVAELAKDLVARQKFMLERLAAKLDHAERLRAASSVPPTKLTEKMMEHYINSHEEYQEAMLQFLEFKKQYGLLSVGRDAMEQRKDMLISIGANYRAEASANPSILMAAARDRARQAYEQKNEDSTEPKRTPVARRP